ncbi:hypothetical protein BurJ1DRAFT_2492 [Burkholderiales bacterium JOSHI_001]|nr:hypothetical protein BurJ1DRAFT_2492 [Burkholderiales bacterium JOSHI_001]
MQGETYNFSLTGPVPHPLSAGATTLKIQPDRLEGVNTINRLEGGRVWVGATAHEGAVLVPWQGVVLPWAVPGFDSLSPEHFAPVLALKPELVIFGSGARQRFAHPRLVAALIAQRIGVESMDSAAACRTYNVLASEGRQVVAALLPGDAG